MTYDAYLLKEKKIVLFWSRKSANTSLAEWLVEVATPEAGKPQKRPARRTVERYLPSVEAPEALRYIREEHYQDFVLARNPYRRAISAYVEKFCYYGDKHLSQVGALKGFAQKLFLEVMGSRGRSAEAGDYEVPEDYEGLSFVDFLQRIVWHVKNPGQLGEPRLNGHWGPQVPLLFDRENFEYSHIIHLEKVGQEFPPLAAAMGTDRPFPHSRSNETHGVTTVSDRDLSRMPSAEIVRQKLLPAPASLLTDETVALMREAYALDFRKLKYDPDQVPGMTRQPAAASA